MTLNLRSADVETILSVPHQIFLDERLLSILPEDDHQTIPVTAFDSSGLLYRPGLHPDGRDPIDKDHVLALDAVPHNVLAVIGTAADPEPAKALMSVFAEQDADPMPVLLTASPDGRAEDERQHILAALAPSLMRQLATVSNLHAEREAELAEARRAAEWQSLSLRRGREMVSALGHSARSLAYEIGAGTQTIGPDGDFARSAFVTRLPIDLAGLCGLSFHVADEVHKEIGAGHLVLTVGSPDLRHPFVRTEIPYGELTPGWNDVVFDGPIGSSHGDGVLTVAFVGTGAPLLSMGEEHTDRFGLTGAGEGRSPSLKVWKGFAPDLFSAHPDVPLRISTIEPDMTGAVFLFGAAEETLERQKNAGQSPISLTDTGGLRVLTREHAPTGVLLRSILPARTVEVRLRIDRHAGANVPSPSPLASPARAGLLRRSGSLLASLLPTSKDNDQTTHDSRETTGRAVALVPLAPNQTELLELRERASAILSGETPDKDNGKGDQVTSIQYPNANPSMLRLTFDPPLTEAKSLAVLLGSRELQGAGATACDLDNLAIDLAETPAPDQLPVFGRRIPFPELKSRTSYLFGAGEAIRLSQDAGLPVMQVSDLENHMETHALQAHVTGARVTGLLASGLTRLRAVVETAHPQGPDVEYGLFVLKSGAGLDNPAAFAKTFDTYLQNRRTAAPSFLLAGAVASIAPGAPGSVTLDLDVPLRAPADLVCTVRSLSGHTNYAWCRWHSVDVVMEPAPDTRQHVAPRAS